MATLKEVGGSFPLYELRTGESSEKDKVSQWEVSATLDRLIKNQRLQNVLTGNNLLYAGVKQQTLFTCMPWSTKVISTALINVPAAARRSPSCSGKSYRSMAARYSAMKK